MRQRKWVVGSVAGLLLAGAVTGLAIGQPWASQSGRAPAHNHPVVSATLTIPSAFPSGSRFEPVTEVAVGPDDRTIVAAVGWFCALTPHLYASETRTQVALLLVQPPAPTHAICPASATVGPAGIRLSAPLGARPLIDRDTGRPVRFLAPSQVAAVTVLPAAYRLLDYWPGGVAVPVAQTRYYGPNASYAGLAVSQGVGNNPPNGPSGWPLQITLRVHGHPAQLRVSPDPTTRRVTIRQLSWAENGYIFVLVTYSGPHGEPPLTDGELTAIADGIVP